MDLSLPDPVDEPLDAILHHLSDLLPALAGPCEFVMEGVEDIKVYFPEEGHGSNLHTSLHLLGQDGTFR